MTEQQLQVFLEYTRRFEVMSSELPMFLRMNDPTVGIKSSNIAPEFVDSFMLRYLNISSEEWYLHEKGLITDEIWGMWKHAIEQTLKGNMLFGEFWWTKCRTNFLKADGSATAFVKFVDATVPAQKNFPKSKLAKGHKIRTDKK